MPGQGGTQRLPKFIPRAKAAEMMMMGTSIDAQEAYRLGLVNIVVPLPELMTTAREWATTICNNGPLAVKAVKEAMTFGLEKTLDDGIDYEKSLVEQLLRADDAKEGAKAFAEKRKPIFKGK